MTHQWCLAKFSRPVDARAAIRRLMKAGIDPESMDVMTSQPIHGEPFLPEKRPTKLRTWALCGAAAGMVGGCSLATFTALAYPLVKGGVVVAVPCSDQNRKAIEDAVGAAGATKVNWV